MYPKLIGEHPIWDRKDVLMSNGKPFDKKTARAQMLEFTTSDLISAETNVLMSEEEAARKLNAESLVVWRELAGSITTLLTKSNLTWYHVTRPVLQKPRQA